MYLTARSVRLQAVALSYRQRLYTASPKYLISKPNVCINLAGKVQRQAHAAVLLGALSTIQPLLRQKPGSSEEEDMVLDLTTVEGIYLANHDCWVF